ncbi:hypothetical protein V2J09_005421 [Rumex salicifolius]
MAIPMATTEMVADQRRAEMIQLLDLLFQEGVLDEEFNRIQSMEDETSPDFVVDVIHSFFGDIEKISKIFHELLFVLRLISILLVKKQRQGKHRFRESRVDLELYLRCLDVLELMDMEFIYYKTKMEEFIEIKREFEIASGIAFPQNEEVP